MFQPSRYEQLSWRDRLRTDAGRRLAGIVLALVFELLLLILLLTLSRGEGGIGEDVPILSTFDAGEDIEDAPESEPEPEPQPEAAAAPRTIDQPQPPQPDTPAPASAPAIQLPRESTQTFDISQVPREPAKPSPAQPAMGPPDRRSRNDTPVVGRRANGEPVYAAQWYREPSEQELRGYLSTAAPGPGWALIECKTAPDFRVENCEFIGEYPQGSQLGRAWLAASWQFRVRPPRKGNSYLVGEWVRIRLVLSREGA